MEEHRAAARRPPDARSRDRAAGSSSSTSTSPRPAPAPKVRRSADERAAARRREPPHRVRHARRLPARGRRRRLRDRAGRHARRRRRVGLRQVGDRALGDAPDRPARPDRGGLAHPLRGPRPRHARGERAREDPRQRHLDDLPGADDLAEPGVHRGRPDRRGSAAAPEGRPEGGHGPGGRDDAARRHSLAGAARPGLSPPAVRRHAPAGDDRDGAELQPEAADRRRADDGARRDRAGADPRADEGAARAARDGDPADHARPRRRGGDGRRGGGDVRRPDRRARPGRRDLRQPAAPVHRGAARLDPAARDAVLATAEGDPRRRPEPARVAGSLPLRAALRLRLRQVHGGRPAAPARAAAGVGVLAVRARPPRAADDEAIA